MNVRGKSPSVLAGLVPTIVPGTLSPAMAGTVPRDDRLRLEYLELVDPRTFQPVRQIAGPVVAAGALWVGSTRLIDNVLCIPPA